MRPPRSSEASDNRTPTSAMCDLARVARVSTTIGPTWRGVVDDAAIFPPGDAPLAPAALDEVAAAEHRLKLRTGGLEARAFPASSTLAGWIDAALDRELPFKATAGLHRAVRHRADDGFDHHGFLNLLVATRLAFDGA